MSLTNGQAPQTSAKVLNSQDIANGILPANSVFIDKGSPWENPFSIGIHGDRDEIVDRYEHLLAHSPETLESLDYLKGKDLICYCAPRRCHGDVLIKLAAMNYRERLLWAEKIKAKHGELLQAA